MDTRIEPDPPGQGPYYAIMTTEQVETAYVWSEQGSGWLKKLGQQIVAGVKARMASMTLDDWVAERSKADRAANLWVGLVKKGSDRRDGHVRDMGTNDQAGIRSVGVEHDGIETSSQSALADW